jgi:hypothetical protein
MADLNAFVSMSCPSDIDEKLATTTTELEAASRAAEITQKAKLAPLPALEFAPDVSTVLTRELGELSADAETRVRDH